MFRITEVSIKEFKTSIYLIPWTMNYRLKGKKRRWDALEEHSSVSVVIYNKTRDVLVFIRQFRPTVYYSALPTEEKIKAEINVEQYPADNALTIELCGGIIDRYFPPHKIAKQKVFKGTGYNVPLGSLERIAAYRANVGKSGQKQIAYYCEVTDHMKTGPGGGAPHDKFEVVEMTVPKIKSYISKPDVLSTGGLLFAIYWFLTYKVKDKKGGESVKKK